MKSKIYALAGALAVAASISIPQQAKAQTNEQIRESFENPGKSARPRVWWHWMNGNITKDGIKKDLLWMDKAGIVGFHNFDAGLETPQVVDHRLPYMSEEWKDAFKYALHLADSLKMEVTIASSPGWSETGGPWVSDEDGMKKLVWRTVDIEGQLQPAAKGRRGAKRQAAPALQRVVLPGGFGVAGPFQDDEHVSWEVDARKNFYRDIAVLAIKVPENYVDLKSENPTITASNLAKGELTYDNLNSDSVKGGVRILSDKNGQAWLQYAFEKPQTINSIIISELKIKGDKNAIVRELQVSDDGQNFRTVTTLGYQWNIQKTYSLKPLTAKYFRVLFKDNQKLAGGGFDVYQCMLSNAPAIQDAGDKAGFGFYRLLSFETSQPSKGFAQTEEILDLTDNVKDGVLEWAAPQGRWKIYRFGYSLTGKSNHPASPEATGLEVDKIDPDAVRRYFKAYLQTYQDASGGKLGPEGIAYLLTDSYEAGPQTWTGHMEQEFAKRRGYELRKWLPALTGMVVNSTDETERFLFDWRTCIGDMIAEYHYDIQNEILKEYGMLRYTESHESWRANLSDGMECKKYAAVPMSAFWRFYKQGQIFNSRFEADIRESASVAHIYGQNITAAESLTADGRRDGAWVFAPEVLKPTADAAMAAGLNRFVIHCSTHQPVDNLKPGLGLGKWGQWFNRHQTWAGQARAWTDYLSRSCELLQAGRNVADIALYYGEDNNVTGLFQNASSKWLAAGYNYDYFNPSVLCKLAKPSGSGLAVPSGAQYKVLVLDANVRIMSLQVLRRIKELADAGVLICGAKPQILGNHEGGKAEFDALVADIWGSGRPNVSTGVPTAQVLAKAGIAPDFSCEGCGKDVLYVHRTLGDGREIYWLSNQTDRTISLNAVFRTAGKKPVLWNAEDATSQEVSYSIGATSTTASLTLTPYKSVFVMFLADAAEQSQTIARPVSVPVSDLSAGWSVAFEPGRGAPAAIEMPVLESLTANAEPGVKYFSGTATYTREFKLSRKDARSGKRFVLDLGNVKDIAEVYVNGAQVATLWHTPYSVDITSALRKGTNTLEVRVTNLWHNRIVGDMQPGVTEKITYYPMDLLTADEPLLPAGLMGPVTVNRLD